ncbi:MAG: carboxypeptidase M32 [Planctomycetota bacterium]
MFDSPEVQALADEVRRLSDLESALALLGWDQETAMPRGGAGARARSRGELTQIIHSRWQADSFQRLLESAESSVNGGADRDGRLVKEIRRRFDLRVRVPAELAEETARATSEAQSAWIDARKASKFAEFAPHLERLITLRRRAAEALRSGDESLYDALHDKYEPHGRSARVRELGETVKPRLIALTEKYAPICRETRRDFLERSFAVDQQKAFGERVLADLGYDLDHGLIEVSTHPFCSGIASPTDVRVTTRYSENDVKSALTGLIHECGHALYEQGFDPKLAGTPGAEATSMGIHESQSRLWENQVGTSPEFWQHYLPQLKQHFPDALGDVELDDFVRAFNIVEPSMIRVDADEVTYNLHVLLRFEIESELIDGDLTVSELPELWNAKMEEYLGIRPANDAEGVLQDIHWSMGAFGYFPTYFLGNLYSAQIYRAARQALPELDGQIAHHVSHPTACPHLPSKSICCCPSC